MLPVSSDHAIPFPSTAMPIDAYINDNIFNGCPALAVRGGRRACTKKSAKTPPGLRK
jgi:hypothetical protein